MLYESFYLSTAQDTEKAKSPMKIKVKWVSKILTNLFRDEQLLINNLKSSFAQGLAKFSLGGHVDAH